MEQPKPFKIQSHLDGLEAILGTKKDELQKEQNALEEVLQTIRKLESLQQTYEEYSWELVDVAQMEHTIFQKIEPLKKIQRLFEMVRQDPEYTSVSCTPAEIETKYNLDKMDSYQLRIKEINTEMESIQAQIAEHPEQWEIYYQKEATNTEEIIEEVTEQIQDLEKEISDLQDTVNCLKQQAKLDQAITRYSDYIYYYWNVDSQPWIHQFLITSGKHQNVPFTEEDIRELVDFITLEKESHETGNQQLPDWYEQNIRKFEAALRRSFGDQPELIVAFAHTLHLKRFPIGFFDQTTPFGILEETSPDQGVDPWQAQQVLMESMFGEDIPQMLKEARKVWVSNPQRFYFSFHKPQEGELKTMKQLMNIKRFLKDYWRYQNFFEFSINHSIHVYPQSVTQKEQRDAYNSYKKLREGQGRYLCKQNK